MNVDKYGQVILNVDEIFAGLYSGKIKDLSKVLTDNAVAAQQFKLAVKENYDNIPVLEIYKEPGKFDSLEMFDEANQCTWFMPEDATKFPILEWLYEQCNSETERARVDEEIELFIQHGMFDLLFYLKYLVDTMRTNKIVWGVGRGSSVASYVLYLIGIHKVDSIKYNLDIREFLR
jgi:DNA polymerase III alpha subunit